MKPTKSNHIVLALALLSTFTTFYVAQLREASRRSAAKADQPSTSSAP